MVAGVVSAPALQRRWWAGAGRGAYMAIGSAGPQQLRCRRWATCRPPALGSASLSGWGPRRDRFLGLTDTVWRVRAYGDFFSYPWWRTHLSMAGQTRSVRVDLAPLDILVREAAAFSVDGVAGPHGGSAVATKTRLHNEVLA